MYPDEGHGFVKPNNRISFNAIAEAFLGNCLGGRVEPLGGTLQKSTAQILNGAMYIPGLAEAAVKKWSRKKLGKFNGMLALAIFRNSFGKRLFIILSFGVVPKISSF